MPDPLPIAAALAVAVAITIALRAVPFGMKGALRDSALLADIGRWMPLGAITILAVYCLTAIDLAAPARGVPELTGAAVTLTAHAWLRNAALSILAGTAACLVLANGVLV